MNVALLEETTDAELFLEDDAYCAQEKLNGERMLVEKCGSAVKAFNRRGVERELPETVAAVALTSDSDFLIDGEWVAGEFVAFDAQSINGASITALPQSARFAALCAVSPFRVVRSAIGDDKAALVASVRSEKGEGVVFKRLSAPYADGRTDSAVKFKFWKSASFTVRDVNIAKGTVGLSIGSQDFGRCSFPFAGDWPKAGEIVEVRYLLVTKNGKLSQPRFLGIRPDLVVEDVISQTLS